MNMFSFPFFDLEDIYSQSSPDFKQLSKEVSGKEVTSEVMYNHWGAQKSLKDSKIPGPLLFLLWCMMKPYMTI